jgi:hypothetical protein
MFWRRRKPAEATAVLEQLRAAIRRFKAVAAGTAEWPDESEEIGFEVMVKESDKIVRLEGRLARDVHDARLDLIEAMERALATMAPLPPPLTAEEIAESHRRIAESLARYNAMTLEEQDAYNRKEFEAFLNRKRDGQ